MKEKISVTIDSSVLKAVEGIVDGIRIKNRSDAIEYLLKRSVGEKRVAVILCGGDVGSNRLSTGSIRFVAMIDGVPVIEDTVMQLKAFGFSKIFIVGRNEVITQIFSILRNGDGLGVSLEYVEEKESHGTAESLRLVSPWIDSDFLVVYGDVVFRIDLDRLFREHLANGGVATLALSSTANPSEKGTVELDGNRVLKFSQKIRSSESFIAFSSLFVAQPDMFNVAGGSLESDVFPRLAESGKIYGLVLQGKRIHIHKADDLARARDMVAK